MTSLYRPTAQVQLFPTALTAEQVNAIAALKLTNAELQAFYVETGITEAKTPEPGVTPQSQRMSDLP